jgi:hypothetical protein
MVNPREATFIPDKTRDRFWETTRCVINLLPRAK